LFFKKLFLSIRFKYQRSTQICWPNAMISIFGSERTNYSRLSTSRPCSVASSIQFRRFVCTFFLSFSWGEGFVSPNEGQTFLTPTRFILGHHRFRYLGVWLNNVLTEEEEEGQSFLPQLDLSSVIGFGYLGVWLNNVLTEAEEDDDEWDRWRFICWFHFLFRFVEFKVTRLWEVVKWVVVLSPYWPWSFFIS